MGRAALVAAVLAGSTVVRGSPSGHPGAEPDPTLAFSVQAAEGRTFVNKVCCFLL